MQIRALELESWSRSLVNGEMHAVLGVDEGMCVYMFMYTYIHKESGQICVSSTFQEK